MRSRAFLPSSPREYLLFWVFLLAPILVFPYRFHRGVTVAAAVASVAPAFWAAFVRAPRWPARLLSVFLLLASLPGWLVAPVPAVTAEKMPLLLLALSVFWCVAIGITDLAGAVRWTMLLVWGTAALSAVGPFVTDFAAKNRYFSYHLSALARFKVHEILDPNLLAGLIVLVLPSGLALCWPGDGGTLGRRVNVVLWLACAILLTTLLFTESRAGGLAAVICATVFVIARRPRTWIVLAAIGVVVVVLLATGVIGFDKVAASSALPTWEARREVWNRSLYIIQDFPLTGVGAGAFPRLVSEFYPLFRSTVEVYHAHNLFLQVAIDFGLPGLVAFSSLLAGVAILGLNAARSFRGQGNPLGGRLVVGYSLGLLAMVVHGLFDAPLWLTKPHAVAFFQMAMLVALHRISQPTPHAQATPHGAIVVAGWMLVGALAAALAGTSPMTAVAVAVSGGVYVSWLEVRHACG